MLLDLDPRHIHVYWHIPETSAPDGPLSLRIHDLAYMDLSASNPHACLELLVEQARGERSLPMPAGRTLRAEIGLPGPCRAFTALARSETLRLPPAGPCLYQHPEKTPQRPERNTAFSQRVFPFVPPQTSASRQLSLCAGNACAMPDLAAAQTEPAVEAESLETLYYSGAGMVGGE